METSNYPRYNYENYKNWKEDWELIHGYPFELLPSASPKHSKTQSKLIYQAIHSLEKNGEKCNCEVFTKLDWKINNETVVRPDIMVICGETDETILEFPPVLIIEILSPRNIKTARVLKFDLYRENGVNFYLMVDCQKETVEVYVLIDNLYKQTKNTEFQIDKTCLIHFDFEKLWK
jgi:Uma2 family endonuclease